MESNRASSLISCTQQGANVNLSLWLHLAPLGYLWNVLNESNGTDKVLLQDLRLEKPKQSCVEKRPMSERKRDAPHAPLRTQRSSPNENVSSHKVVVPHATCDVEA